MRSAITTLATFKLLYRSGGFSLGRPSTAWLIGIKGNLTWDMPASFLLCTCCLRSKSGPGRASGCDLDCKAPRGAT
ncbi:hypothetical protein Nepgr_027426 [Nepenthes gracilis]|uniref:Uncharacterized protein n=1 Tax=Nepenthes gracilis TaxID=150966 RepID=A0AAD3TAD5_NEPGR|nr:hypothetical protein Nepgr_027426 [Nepenthes gracilis]